ncbi:MAG: hypothetical protein A3G13_02645 [Candidatus Levybacteria bacterium RIFCSPLOWO2_12_FULL_37_7]|nr:MAG: hypothetical protein A3G13_02645 [Candidatus Levybacteria bacterium RIFCSPLOWO2_12_FULL_37_7]
MSKKTLGLIAVLLVLASVLIFVAVSQKKAQEQPLNTVNTQQAATSPTVVKVPATTTLAFSSISLPVTNTPQQFPITINSSNEVTAIQLELTFDPLKLTNASIAQPVTDAFLDKPTELLKNVDIKKGRITYAFGISPSQNPKKGTGTVAVLSFTPKLNPGEQTKISFLPKTLVTALGVNESVLKSTTNTTITGQ